MPGHPHHHPGLSKEPGEPGRAADLNRERGERWKAVTKTMARSKGPRNSCQGKLVKVRLPESEPGKRDGGLYQAVFIEYVGQDQCRVRWPEWGVGFAPAPTVDLDDVT
jgi:hypothetical protein